MTWAHGTPVETTQLATSSPVWNLPAGIVAGDYILLCICLGDEDTTGGEETITVTGYTEIGSQTSTGASSGQTLAMFYKKATGGETTASGTCTATEGEVSTLCVAHKVDGGDPDTIIDVTVPAFGTGAGNASSPAIDPTNTDTLYLAAAVYDGNPDGAFSDASIPSDTTLIGTMEDATIGNGCSLGFAYLELASDAAKGANDWNDAGAEEYVAAAVCLRQQVAASPIITIPNAVINGRASTGDNTPTFTLPTYIADDVIHLYVNVGRENGGAITAGLSISGWTELGTSIATGAASPQRLHIFRKVMTGAEGSSVTGSIDTGNGSGVHTCIYLAVGYRNVDTGTPEDATTPAYVSSSTMPMQSPAIPTVTDNSFVVSVVIADNDAGGWGGDADIPAGTTLLGTHDDQGIANGNILGAAYEDEPFFGVIAAKSWTDPAGDEEWLAATVAIRPATGDVTAPILTNPAAVGVTTSAVTPRCQTDEGNGIMYMVVVPDADVPSVAQIKAGQQSDSSPALAADNDPISTTGAHTFTEVTGLTGATEHEIYYVHTDAADNDSAAVTVGFLTTVGGPSFVVSTTVQERTSVSFRLGATSDENATWYAVAVKQGEAAPSIAQVKLGQNSASAAADADASIAVIGNTPAVLHLGTAFGAGFGNGFG